jgi:hypothetical protein
LECTELLLGHSLFSEVLGDIDVDDAAGCDIGR